ncbi:MAG: hypothetical protein EOO65_03290, partial [Methanosarcinales archaeon]
MNLAPENGFVPPHSCCTPATHFCTPPSNMWDGTVQLWWRAVAARVHATRAAQFASLLRAAPYALHMAASWEAVADPA